MTKDRRTPPPQRNAKSKSSKPSKSSNASHSRGSGSRKPRTDAPGRRTPPPDETGDEGRFLKDCKKTETKMVAQLVDGTNLTGVIAWFDQDLIEFSCDYGPFVIRKSEIRYLHGVE